MSELKTYSELIKYKTFEERFRYLQLNSKVGEETFGKERYLNQILYKTAEWKKARDEAIIRDKGCDLGIEERVIFGRVIVHHINPITVEQVLNRDPIIFDLEYLITISHITHEAIHYGDESLLVSNPIVREYGDTKLW